MATQNHTHTLDENDPAERVVVLRSDLEQWVDVMRWAHGMASAADLTIGYLQGRPNAKRSRLTVMSAQTHNKILGYLEENDVSTEQLL